MNKNKKVKRNNIILFSLLILTILTSLILVKFKFLSQAEYDAGTNGKVVTLTSKDTLSINFKSYLDELDGIKFKAAEPKNDDGCFFVSIYNDSNNKIYYKDLNSIAFFDGVYYDFNFDDVKDSMDKNFKFEITGNGTNKCNLSVFYVNGDDPFNETEINGDDKEDVLLIQEGKKRSYKYLFIPMIVAIILFFLFIRNNFFDNKKLKDKMLKHKRVFIIEFIASVLFSFSIIKFLVISNNMGYIPLKYAALGIVSFGVLFSIISLFIGDKDLKKEDLFLLLAIPLSILMLATISPLNKPDELFHYKSSYLVSKLDLFGTKGTFVDLLEGKKYLEVMNTIENTGYYDLISNSRSRYNFIFYIFSGLGILGARIINLSPLIGVYIGGLMNIVVFLIIGYISVKKIPFGKMLLVFYMLNPMFLQTVSSLSTDALNNVFSILFISYILYIYKDKKKIETKDFLALSISILFIVACKTKGFIAPYFPLILLLIPIFKYLVNYIKEHKLIGVLSVILILFISFSYSYILSSVNNSNTSQIAKIAGEIPFTNETKVQYILKNPFNYVSVLINTYILCKTFYILTFFGSSLGALNIAIPTELVIGYIVLLVLSIFFDKNEKELLIKDKMLLVIITIISINVVIAGLYSSWGIINDLFVQGVQGRYFLPFMILIPLCISSKKHKISTEKSDFWLPTLLLINYVSLFIAIIRYGLY